MIFKSKSKTPNSLKSLGFVFLIVAVLAFSSAVSVNAFETEGVPVSVIGGAHYFGEPIHQDITREGLYFLKPDPLELIVDQHVVIEQDQSSPNHFDNCQFKETIDRINARYDVAVSAFNPTNPQPNLGAEKFGMILHAVQDFYAHSNWIEMKRTDLVDPWLGHWRQLNPYSDSSNDRPVFVLEEDGSPTMDFQISLRSKKATVSHDSWGATGSNRKMGLISGTFDADVNKCPANASIPHGGKLINRFNRTPESSDFPDELNKDNPAIKGHAAARALAVQQTTHEFCRLVELTRQAYGDRGVQIIYDNWVQGQYLIDSPFNNARCPTPDSTSVISDNSHASVGSNNKLAVNQKAANATSQVKVSKDGLKSLYLISKWNEATATSLVAINDHEIKMIKDAQKSKQTISKSSEIKSLLKQQESDKKKIKEIQTFAKKISAEAKKLAIKQGVTAIDLTKIVKTPQQKIDKPTKITRNQLKQSVDDAKANLDEARKQQQKNDEELRIAAYILSDAMDAHPILTKYHEQGLEFFNPYEIPALLKEHRSDLGRAEITALEERYAAQKAKDKTAEEHQQEEKNRENVLALMQQAIDILIKEEQTQTSSILDTIPDPTLKEMVAHTADTKPVAKKDPSKPVIPPSTTPTVQPKVVIPDVKLEPKTTNTKPSLTIPRQVTQEATSSSGASVNYNASGQDKEDGLLTPTCDHPPGSTFPIGTTTVSCVVKDSANNSISGTFTVTVRDTTPPNIPAFQPTEGTRDETGVVVFFEVTANDLVDGNVPVSCNYPSGTKFPIGVTVLTCAADDSRGNHASRSLQITVTVKESGQ